MSLAELYKEIGTDFTGTITSFKREVNVKNNVVHSQDPSPGMMKYTMQLLKKPDNRLLC